MYRPILALLTANVMAVGVTGWSFYATLTHDGTHSQPRAVLRANELDLGTVQQGETLRAHFPIRNAGGRRLIVTPQSTQCCEELTPIIVEPGETQLLASEIDTTQSGSLSRREWYTTNDPESPRFRLTINVEVRPKQ